MKSFWQSGFPPAGPVKAAWWAVRVHVGKLLAGPVDFNGAGLVGLLLLVLGARSLWRSGRRALLLLCLLPFALHLGAALLHRYPYGTHARLEQHLAAPFCLLAGSGIASLLERLPSARARAGGLLTVAAGLVLVGVVVSLGYLAQPYHDEHARWADDVARHLRREMGADDHISLLRDDNHPCLDWQLLSLADRLTGPATGRTWALDVRIEHVALGAPEPERRSLSEWRPVKRWRFSGSVSHDRVHADRCYCDVYLCPPAAVTIQSCTTISTSSGTTPPRPSGSAPASGCTSTRSTAPCRATPAFTSWAARRGAADCTR
jgi:hypothetical protein